MSLYYEASKALTEYALSQKPLKRIVYDDKSLKSAPATVFALVTEATKWSKVLAKIIDDIALLHHEKKVGHRILTSCA